MEALARFAERAEEFCALIDSRDAHGRAAFLRRVHLGLAPLYAAALVLPAVEVIEDGPEDDDDDLVDSPPAAAQDDRLGMERWQALYRSLSALIGERNHYAEVFDPYAEPPEEPVTGSLADDLADIYQDLADGLAKWRRGEAAAALWRWRFQFTTHWGEHLTSALRALHVLAANYDVGFPTTERADV